MILTVFSLGKGGVGLISIRFCGLANVYQNKRFYDEKEKLSGDSESRLLMK